MTKEGEKTMANISRRQFLYGGALFGLVVALKPGLVLANATTDNRLVIVINRGAMDGLAAVAPYGDPNYASLRGDLAMSPDSLLKLDDRFGLHPSLKPLHDMYADGDLAVIHAASSPYRERSHFDGQNVLELGGTQPHDLQDGWLNRVVASINGHDDKLALAVGDTVPMILQGPAMVGSWAPSVLPQTGQDFMSALDKIYGGDPQFAQAFHEAIDLQAKGDDALQGTDAQKIAQQSHSQQSFVALAGIAGTWLARPDGPRLATLELSGWDTHVQQGTEGGRLANNLDLLARGIQAMKDKLGPAWSKTTVVMLTEFGRTARPNGTGGTDHGTGTVALMAGGAVKGGVYGQWPGLSDDALYQNRDLMPTTDVRSVMKGTLAGLFQFSDTVLDRDIYPGSAQTGKMQGLVKV
jgi:uncharacterized protein (DUF1501 family)